MAKEKRRKMTNTEIKDFILTNEKEAEENMKTFRDKIKDYKKQFESIPREDQPYEGLANTFVPETFKGINTVKIRIMQHLKEFFAIKDTGILQPAILHGYTEYIKKQHKEADLEIELEKNVESLLKNGASICKVYEHFEEKKVTRPTPQVMLDEAGNVVTYKTPTPDGQIRDTGQPIITGTKPEKITLRKAFPYLENLHWNNISILGKTTNFKKIDGIIEKIENVSWYDLWKMRKRIVKVNGKDIERGVYINLEKVLERNLMPESEKEEEEIDNDVETSEAVKKKKDVRTCKHTLKETWVRGDIERDGSNDVWLLTLLNDNMIIRKQKNPFNHGRIPYLLCPCFTKDDDMFGLGFCQIIERPQAELNAKRNQMLDNVTYNINSMKIVSDPNINDSELENTPGGIIRSSMGEAAITNLAPSLMNIQGTNQAEMLLKDDINTALGVPRSFQGGATGGRGTATEVTQLASSAEIRILDIVKNLENYILRPFMYMHHSLNRQFPEEVYYTEMVNPDYGKKRNNGTPQSKYVQQIFKINDINFDMDFEMLLVRDVKNKVIEIKQLQDYLAMLGTANLPPNIVARPYIKIMRRIWTLMGYGNTEEIFPVGFEDQLVQGMQSQIPGQPGQQALLDKMPPGTGGRVGQQMQ